MLSQIPFSRMCYFTSLKKPVILLLLVAGSTDLRAQLKPKHKFYMGMDVFGDRGAANEFFNTEALDSLGVEFAVWHYHTRNATVQEGAQRMERLVDALRKQNIKGIVNVEEGNFNLNVAGADGVSLIRKSDNTHLYQFPDPILKALNAPDVIWGIQYDELEHSQITRNMSISIEHPDKELACLVETTGMNFKEADSAVQQSAAELYQSINRFGIPNVYTEHVWPVLFHNFAKAGLTPVYKQMKEGWSNVWAAAAMGAAIQYDKELWACLDFWHGGKYPGHTPQSMASNFLFAYWAGVDKAYVESMGKHTYQLDQQGRVNLLASGLAYRKFAKEYVPQHARNYSFRDYDPEIAIVRFDDTEWGQGEDVYTTVRSTRSGSVQSRLYWKDFLFGAYNLKTSAESEEWIRAWHSITHGATHKKSLSWNAANIYQGRAYRCFAPANSPVVFDQDVKAELLEHVKLTFLCGLYMNENTLSGVRELVKNGMVVVTSARFAPETIQKKYKNGTAVFTDGKGKWIVTDDMASNDVKAQIKPFIGGENQISLRFKSNRKVVFDISPDGTELKVRELSVN
jgi:hypothetical protein